MAGQVGGRSDRLDPRGGALDSSALLRRLPGVGRWDLEVVDHRALTPSMLRLRLRASGLGALDYRAGQDLMVAVPAASGGHFRRRYTIRHLDRVADAADVDVVLHGDRRAPGTAWALGARRGDRVEALGPRGRIFVDEHAAWHLFAGDDTALPVTSAMIESLPAGATALVVLEVDGPEDEVAPAVPEGADHRWRWLHRGGRPAGGAASLVEAVARMPLPPGRGHAYVAGEQSVVAAVRAALLERGLEAAQVSAKAYWRRGVANAAHGEPGSH
ncbi:MAG: siderophore-interacting protein [Acidimicrobiales bacterium]